MGGENGDAAAATAAAAGVKEEGKEKGRRKFAVLLCADDSEYVRKAYGGYFKVFVGLLGEEDEAWHVYRAAHGELPTAAEADGYDGFVITGSCNDAHGNDPWIEDLVAFLRALDAKKKKVLGVCFGHQDKTAYNRPLSEPGIYDLEQGSRGDDRQSQQRLGHRSHLHPPHPHHYQGAVLAPHPLSSPRSRIPPRRSMATASSSRGASLVREDQH